MTLSTIMVCGVGIKPSTVMINGQNVKYEYNDNQVCLIIGVCVCVCVAHGY